MHHLDEPKARQILQKYYVGDCPNQVVRFSFEEEGFYRTLKRRVLQKYSLKEMQDETHSKLLGIGILIAWIICITLTIANHSYLWAMVCAPLMVGLVGIGHNFVHHKENPFRYFFFLTGFTHR